ncbi:MutS-related protein [Companilactobacillus halodurans]|uniref:DNA mismatch repair proteins mutS family domain-containing protein n=1 Tax=Companilactobacillus halodurans TaxID=2584183 RepID=A0A5P0ZM16_9LACO|nr:hypothetical protein [Companilactobacillus halodurans]MQS75247.1 hypothetical protein [Companilactobacillus halodurans]MQS97596.1 hypothetical protein [Companilactobacillus halodurans]
MFNSLLFTNTNKPAELLPNDDPIFQDLNLDDLFLQVNQLTGFDISEFNHQPLIDDEEIRYRQETFKDFQNEDIYHDFEDFTKQMLYSMKEHEEIHKLYPQAYREHKLVNILDDELNAIHSLILNLQDLSLDSKGLVKFIDYLEEYENSEKILAIKKDIKNINHDFNDIYYRLYLNGRNVTVEASPEPKESMDSRFEEIFTPIFNHQKDLTKPVKMDDIYGSYNMNNLQVSIITELVKLYPDQFAEMNQFYQKYATYHDELIEKIVKELTFFLAWQKAELTVEKIGHLAFTLPILVKSGSKRIDNSFDFGLALKQFTSTQTIVTNQVEINPKKPFLVISGPNQGGKTTYARMVGQIFYLARLGIAIAGTSAKIRTRQSIFTHFDRQESSNKLSGLLETDVERIHQIIQKVDQNSFVILNELFSSTSEEDATKLGTRVVKELDKRHASGIYVTFLESLGTLPQVQPLMSQVTADAKRTFKVIPEELNGKAYTDILLNKYHLSQDNIEGKLSQ